MIALAQFSMARAADAVVATGLSVFTTPDSAIRLLQARLFALIDSTSGRTGATGARRTRASSGGKAMRHLSGPRWPDSPPSVRQSPATTSLLCAVGTSHALGMA